MDTYHLDIAREVLSIARSVEQRNVYHKTLAGGFVPRTEVLTFSIRQYELPRVVLSDDQALSYPFHLLPAPMRQAGITVDHFLSLCAQALNTDLQARPQPVILWVTQARLQLQRFIGDLTSGLHLISNSPSPSLDFAIWRLFLDYSLGLNVCLHFKSGPYTRRNLDPNGNPSRWFFIAWKEDQRAEHTALIFKRIPSQPSALTISIENRSLGTSNGITFENERMLPYFMGRRSCSHLLTATFPPGGPHHQMHQAAPYTDKGAPSAGSNADSKAKANAPQMMRTIAYSQRSQSCSSTRSAPAGDFSSEKICQRCGNRSEGKFRGICMDCNDQQEQEDSARSDTGES